MPPPRLWRRSIIRKAGKNRLKTPAGIECPFFYGDYYRGREREECRLIGNVPPPNNWIPDLCKVCPVPGILRANACSSMVLSAIVKRGFLGVGRKINVSAYCNKTFQIVKEPEIGCGQCHPLPDVFSFEKNDTDNSA